MRKYNGQLLGFFIFLTAALPVNIYSQQNSANEQESILHVSGYAYTGYQYEKSGNASFTVGSFSPIFHYLYKDIMLMETELEIEAEEDGSTGFMMEYLTLDLFLNDNMTLLVGKYLSPIGQFKQNLHPSWINKFPTAPIGFGHDGLAPSADVGVQLRGGVPMNNMKIEYAIAVDNGPQFVIGGGHHEDEENADPEPELAQEGFVEDDNKNKVIEGRVCLLPRPNTSFAVSWATGSVLDSVDVDYRLIGFDYYWRPGFMENLELRTEYFDKSVGEETSNVFYAQAAYSLPHSFECALRYGRMENEGDINTQLAAGINYLFSSNVIAKMAYEVNDGDDFVDRLIIQLAYGF